MRWNKIMLERTSVSSVCRDFGKVHTEEHLQNSHTSQVGLHYFASYYVMF